MSKRVSYLVFAGLVAAALAKGAAAASGQIVGSVPATSSSVAPPAETTGIVAMPISTQAVCKKFYDTLEEKKKSAALKHHDATVAAIDEVEVILRKRDPEVAGQPISTAQPVLEKAERDIDAAIPAADHSWYALMHKHRYDYGHQYAPVCPITSN